jgi:hypothetical protein
MTHIMLSRLSTLGLVFIFAVLSLLTFELVATQATRGVRRDLWAPLDLGGVIFGVFAFTVVIVAAIVVYRAPSLRSICIAALLLLCVIAALLLLLPARAVAWEKPRRDRCARNLAQIATGLAQYRAEHGHYPPECETDANGKPMHSWRVLILPNLGYKDLYDEYDFSQPWNGPKNAKLAERRPNIYLCPTNPINYQGERTDTNYAAVTGQGTAWNKNIAPGSAENADKMLLLVEVGKSGICWMEPRDVHQVDILGKTGDLASIGLDSAHREVIQVACADGRVWKLPKDLPATAIAKSLTVGDSGKVAWNALGARPVNLNEAVWGLWLARAALPVWFLFVAILLYRARRSGLARIRARSGSC